MEKNIFNKYLDLIGYDERPDFLNKYLKVPSLQRLKKVGYFCGMDYASTDVYNFKEKISRYDHSLTVCLLTWLLTRDKKASLAGLFHDVSTPCFSHVIDYMNKDYINQESTEEKTEEVIKNDKSLLECLKLDGISVEDIVDFKRYSIVDLNRPGLCADRLDGVILTGLYWTKNINMDNVKDFVSNLQVTPNEDGVLEVGFKNREVAKLVSTTNDLINTYCHSKEDNYMMELLASITKKAINTNVISYEDLFVLDEEKVMEKLKSSNEKGILKGLERFENIKLSEIPDIELPNVKVRDLNPIVLDKRLK